MTESFSLVLLAVFLALSAVIAATETALFSLSRLERRRLVERHPHLGKAVNDLLVHPRRAIVTLLIGSNIVHTAAAALATLLGLQFFGPEGVGVVVALFTLVLIFFGEILPKVFAVRNNESMALVAAPALEILSALLLPLRRLIQWASDWILRLLLGERKEPTGLMSAEELKVLVKIGEEEGVLDRNERKMIQKLFQLGDRPVRSIMTPRVDVAALRLGDPWEKQRDQMKRFHFTHFPVYQDSLDQVVGVVSTQEVILSGGRDLGSFVKPVTYVPDLKLIDDLLRDFQKGTETFAVCVDEFGAVSGIVTLEDILEEIFGEYYDEYAQPEQTVRETGEGEYLVDGKIPLVQFNDLFGSHLHSKEAETLSGFLLEALGRVPKKNDTLDHPKFAFRIHDMARQRIVKVAVRPKR